MKINFDEVPDKYDINKQAIPKGEGRFFCITCHKTMDQKQFFKTLRLEKHPSGYLPECKTCATLLVDDTDPETFLPILKEVNAPYIPNEWRSLLMKKTPGSASILGKYLSKVKLNQFKKYKWKDSQALYDKDRMNLLDALRQESDTESEAEEKVETMINFTDLAKAVKEQAQFGGIPVVQNNPTVYGLNPENSKYGLTAEEINQYKMTWGDDYSEEQYYQLEQMFHDMKEAYIIQDPVAISNAKIICKMTIKLNKYLDIDDMESASKVSKQLDTFTKTANLAPVQQKDRQQTTFAISQLAFLVEKEGGFIPEFDLSTPNDKIDKILLDMKEYTEYLVRGESGLADMVEHAEEILAQDERPDAVEDDEEDFAALEAELLGDIQAIEDSQNGGDYNGLSD